MSMEIIPVVASLDDLPAAFEHGDKNPSARWYIARRAAQLGAADRVPSGWDMQPLAASGGRSTAAYGGDALQDGTFRITGPSDVERAVRGYGLASDPELTRRHIVEHAVRLGATHLLPGDWVSDDLIPSDWGNGGDKSLEASAAVDEPETTELTPTQIGDTLSQALFDYVHGGVEQQQVLDTISQTGITAAAHDAVDEVMTRCQEMLADLRDTDQLESQEYDDLRSALVASVRHVRTPAGVKFYEQPIGSVIVPNEYIPSGRMPFGSLTSGEYFQHGGTRYKALENAKHDAPGKMSVHATDGEKEADIVDDSAKQVQTYKSVPKGTKATLPGAPAATGTPSSPSQRKWYVSNSGRGYTDNPAHAAKDEHGNPISESDKYQAAQAARARETPGGEKVTEAPSRPGLKKRDPSEWGKQFKGSPGKKPPESNVVTPADISAPNTSYIRTGKPKSVTEPSTKPKPDVYTWENRVGSDATRLVKRDAAGKSDEELRAASARAEARGHTDVKNAIDSVLSERSGGGTSTSSSLTSRGLAFHTALRTGASLLQDEKNGSVTKELLRDKITSHIDDLEHQLNNSTAGRDGLTASDLSEARITLSELRAAKTRLKGSKSSAFDVGPSEPSIARAPSASSAGFVHDRQAVLGDVNYGAKGKHPERFQPKLTMADGEIPSKGMTVTHKKNGAGHKVVETYQTHSAVRAPDGSVKTVTNSQLNRDKTASAPAAPAAPAPAPSAPAPSAPATSAPSAPSTPSAATGTPSSVESSLRKAWSDTGEPFPPALDDAFRYGGGGVKAELKDMIKQRELWAVQAKHGGSPGIAKTLAKQQDILEKALKDVSSSTTGGGRVKVSDLLEARKYLAEDTKQANALPRGEERTRVFRDLAEQRAAVQRMQTAIEASGRGGSIPDDGPTIRVDNMAQKIMLENELKGQISDGFWENSGPNDHWKDWSNANVIVDPSHPGRNFRPRKDNYQLNSKALLDIVGGRMVQAVKDDPHGDSSYDTNKMRRDLAGLRKIFKTHRGNLAAT